MTERDPQVKNFHLHCQQNISREVMQVKEIFYKSNKEHKVGHRRGTYLKTWLLIILLATNPLARTF